MADETNGDSQQGECLTSLSCRASLTGVGRPAVGQQVNPKLTKKEKR